MKAERAGRVRSLYAPRPVRVVVGAAEAPRTVITRSGPRPVRAVRDRWRVDDGWWREDPVCRMYYDVELADGQRLVLYHDRRTGRWYRQPYEF